MKSLLRHPNVWVLIPAISGLLFPALSMAAAYAHVEVRGEGKVRVTSDNIVVIVPADFRDIDVSLPNGKVTAIRVFGNYTDGAEPDNRESSVLPRGWVETGNTENLCGNQDPSWWRGRTSSGSPNEADCAELGYAVSFQRGFWSTGQLNNYLTIALRGTCAFGVRLTVGTLCGGEYNVGNTDVTDLIRDSIRFALGGKLGAEGAFLPCRGPGGGNSCAIDWAIYHT